MDTEIKQELTQFARNLGASLIGFAPVTRWDEFNEVEIPYRPHNIWPEAKTVIVIGVPVLLPILETTPSINYVEQYNTANILLDQIAYRLAVHLNDRGHGSMFFPRDGYGDIKILIEKPKASFSHVFAGKYAGLGTIGFNHTLLTEQYGPRVRYASVFTSLALEGGPILTRELCTQCRDCQKVCPSQAFTPREGQVISAMDKVACAKHHAQIRDERRFPCGICIKVCPIGKDRLLYNSTDKTQLYLEEKAAIEENPQDPRYSSWVHVREHGSRGGRIC
ncbi:4Fe-4S dicluster domain-containing protein [Acetonema longum]|uniref:Iron-sulfur cluster-binding protein n=1 Tax=Acetonema longum DSM 6540 TaxID=1009370 RepID=F7NQ13_9FIRM|nr:4Fe-4S dicluster domain-containing protein [Acetonema longum]EGO61890.1 iron-sulfur cluster-binding protein [Acetonema longum DSM 6540]